MKLNEIQDLIKFVSKSGVTSVEIEQKDFKITIQSECKKTEVISIPQQIAMPPAQAPVAAPAPAPVAASPSNESPKPSEEESKYVTINAPMVGTFYRASGPDKDPFISVGDEIKQGKVICIIEAMKLFNEIESEISGKIVKILVDDATPVEYDQPLFLVDPS